MCHVYVYKTTFEIIKVYKWTGSSQGMSWKYKDHKWTGSSQGMSWMY